MELLLVIDMQADYVAAQEADLVTAIEAEARAVLERGGRVLALCYDGSGHHTWELPPGTPVLWKDRNCGGLEVYSWLVGAGLVSRDLRVRIGGVNLCACVFDTANGLAHRLFEEHAICDAVSVVLGLCGNGSKYRVSFETYPLAERSSRV